MDMINIQYLIGAVGLLKIPPRQQELYFTPL
jgi:hypothetical protein